MRLYEVNAALEDLLDKICEIEDQIAEMMAQVDKTSGEIQYDQEELSSLNTEHDRLMEELENIGIIREEKLEGLALYCKNLTAEAEAIKTEKLALEKRQKAALNKANRAKDFLDRNLAGEKLQTARVAVSYRKSKDMEINETAFWPWAVDHTEFVRRKDPEPDKAAISAALKNGQEIPGAELVEKLSMSIR